MMDIFSYTDNLSITEIDRLQVCELKISEGLNTFIDVGNALLEIRDGRLYRQEYRTFEEYCHNRWGMVKTHANRLIAAAEVANNLDLTPIGVKLPPESQLRPLTQLDPEQQREAWQTAVDTAPDGKITAAHVQKVVDEITEKRPVSYHVSDDSYDWYTPAEYIEAARGVMGSIDLDPASSDAAQEIIQAGIYYTKEDDGLSKSWAGNVWLNPPYNMPLIEQFIDTALYHYRAGQITSAIILTNNSTDTGWFHKLIDYPVCFTRGRIQFWNGEDRLATRQGQAIFYLGDNPDLFARVFSIFGAVLRKYDN